MFYQLPPVGNPVVVSTDTGPQPTYGESSSGSLFDAGQLSQLYNSGTVALAAVLLAALAVAKQSKDNVQNPEVIMPAYACPDLVSAAEFVGIKPVLVDLEAGRPWLDLSLLADAITENTVAVVAVNLFGIAERWSLLRELANKNQFVLIEDSAQYFPGADEQYDWQGDLVIFSFGRGKPVSLLGGGAVLSNNAALFKFLPKPQSEPVRYEPPDLGQKLSFGLKARLYNAMISPYLYWLPSAMPFLHLGETRYHRLHEIKAMDKLRLSLLTANIFRYQGDTDAATRCETISSMLDSVDKVKNLPRNCDMPVNRRLLRYPLLVDAVVRDRVYQKLKQAGLGASIMYPASLPKIAGLELLLGDKQNYPNAEMFASQILTLPTHSFVSRKDIEKMKTILKGLDYKQQD